MFVLVSLSDICPHADAPSWEENSARRLRSSVRYVLPIYPLPMDTHNQKVLQWAGLREQ